MQSASRRSILLWPKMGTDPTGQWEHCVGCSPTGDPGALVTFFFPSVCLWSFLRRKRTGRGRDAN